MKIEEVFRENVLQYAEEEKKWEKISFRFSVIRIVLFLVSLFLLVYFANAREVLALTGVVFLFPVIFSILVKRHNSVQRKLQLANNLKSINEEEIQRSEHAFSGLHPGDDWISRDHPYAYDLDIFGQNSLFQLINRTSTPSGESCLAHWLLAPGKEADLLERQVAVKELSADMEWNQKFQAVGRLLQNVQNADQERLLTWLNKPADIPSKPYLLAAYLLPIALVTSIVLTALGIISIYIPLLLLFINGGILKKFQQRLMAVTTYTSGNAKLLGSYEALISMIEKREFSSARMKHLKEPFAHNQSTATQKIATLRKRADFLDGRANMFYQFLNIFFLLDIFLINSAERWKMKNREDIESWFTHIGEVEALISLAGFQIANPEYSVPEFSQNEEVDVQGMGHPLIPPHERIANDFLMKGSGTVIIVTGSNMSGKSTFLRTIGVNAVLAYAGGVVCARRMNIGLFYIFTGMRTEDNLEEHISSFYAELRRIKKLLDYIRDTDRPVLYMLDEILKGTNTKDRHKGSAALVRKLSASRAIGFISTHDLELGSLAIDDDRIHNYSFNSIIENQEIIFNYTIEKGICHSFNASMLMKKIGILEDDDA
jgi:DNA mismatch repair ATPase MutS